MHVAKHPVETAAWEVCEPVVAQMGYELVDVEFVCQAKEWYLNIYVDKPGGILIDECEAVSQAVDPLLDAHPAIRDKHDYLVVSSPGLDRPLRSERDFVRNMGKDVEVKLYAAKDGKKQYAGVLTAADDASVTIEVGGSPVTFERSEVAQIRLAITF